MSLTTALLTFLVAGAVIVAAGIWLTRCADVIAERTGLGRLLVGTVLVAGATSLPELSVDVTAVLNHQTDLAIGDLLGSSLMNLLILAVIDLMHRQAGTAFKRVSLGHALSATLSMLLTAMVVAGILLGHRMPLPAFLGVGVTMWAVLLAYILGVRMVYFDQRQSTLTAAAEGEVPAEAAAETLSLRTALVGFAAAAVVIVISGPFLSHAAAAIAELTGLGTTFVGSTLVALTTSLPEMVATLAAVRMGAFDLAIGNMFGSNAFNMILVLPLDVLQPGTLLGTVSVDHVVTGLSVIIVTAVALLGHLYRVEKRIHLIEPDAALIILLIVGTLLTVYQLGQTPHRPVPPETPTPQQREAAGVWSACRVGFG